MASNFIDFSSDVWKINLPKINMRGMEAEIQLPLKRDPDSSVSSLIQAGWCEEGHPITKTRSNIPMDKQLSYGD